MIVMTTNNFYADYELYKVDSPDLLIEDITTGTFNYKPFASQDDLTTDEAKAMADKILFADDFMED